MNASARQFLRLCAHWPQLGGDDELAEQRAVDWLAIMDRYDERVAAEATERLIANWTGTWHPSIGDWRVVARSIAVWSRPGPPMLEAASPDRERLDALLTPLREHLTMASAAEHTLMPPSAPAPERPDQYRHMASYDDLYPATPTQEETP